jgi:AraC-like DNA-binding protein
MQSYVERPPVPGLSHAVRTVWVHCTDESAYVQRHLPTGGVEIHWPIGGEPQVLGPLTGPVVEIIPARTTIVGVRFWPGITPPVSMALDELLDQRAGLQELGQRWVSRVGDAMGQATTPALALATLQSHLLRELGRSSRPDLLIAEAVQLLMPWRPLTVGTVATHLGLSVSQLRRRCLHSVGMGPKALQRTLRFQGFLALAQAGVTASGRRPTDGLAGLAVDVGYADQAHLSRECLRLTGVTPSQLLGCEVGRCLHAHEHAASYTQFLARRSRPPVRG